MKWGRQLFWYVGMTERNAIRPNATHLNATHRTSTQPNPTHLVKHIFCCIYNNFAEKLNCFKVFISGKSAGDR